MSNTDNTPSLPGGSDLWALAFCFCFLVGCLTALTMTNHDVDPLLRTVSILTGIFGVGGVSIRKLKRIEKQTNGLLHKAVAEQADTAVRTVMREAGYDVAPPVASAAPDNVPAPQASAEPPSEGR